MNNVLHNKKLNIALAIVCLLAGLYLLILWTSPKLPIPVITKTAIDLNTKDDASDKRDRIQIPKLKLEVPFFTGDNDSVLEQGAWHRQPQNGNPKDGGNFVLSAHRFELGWTPALTKLKSPFFNIDKLQNGDEIRIFYQGNWYAYKVAKKYEVSQYALEIEKPSSYSKLTLYSCSLRGPAAGRYVIEALPQILIIKT